MEFFPVLRMFFPPHSRVFLYTHPWQDSKPNAWTVQHSLVSWFCGGSINEARQLISGLQPPVLNEAGVAVAIEHLVEEFRDKNPIQIELQQDPTLARLLTSVEMAIYRIVQESLNNVARHSGASHAWVNLARTDHRILISVRDDGTGFDPESVRKKRYGLVGIRERARLLGGRAVIDSAPGEGTRVTVELAIADTLLDVKNLPVEPPLFGDSI